MQNLVNKLAQERKAHLDTIENLTLKDIKNIVRYWIKTRLDEPNPGFKLIPWFMCSFISLYPTFV